MGVLATGNSVFMLAMYSFLTVVFLLTTLTFLPVGQLCGRLMNRQDNLKSYGLQPAGQCSGSGFCFSGESVSVTSGDLVRALFRSHSFLPDIPCQSASHGRLCVSGSRHYSGMACFHRL